MSDTTPSQERIVSLLWLLLNAGRVGLTREYIRRHIDTYATGQTDLAFDRMFSRDKETLREIGIPVETVGDAQPEPGMEEGEQTRYRIDRSRLALPDVQFDDLERLALWRARTLWEGTSTHAAVVRALGRLDPATEWHSALEQADVDTFGARLAGADRRLTHLEEQIRAGRVVRFGYRTALGGEPETRTVRPWLLMSTASQWYLVGWDLLRQDQRMYRITRFTSEPVSVPPDQVTGAVRERPADLDVHALRRSVTGESGAERAVVRVEPGRAHWLRVGAQHLDSVTEPGPTHGWDRIELHYTRPAEFAGRIASAGATAVVEPDHTGLRKTVLASLQGALTAQRRRQVTVPLTPVKLSRQRESDRDKVAALVDIVGLVNQRGRMSRQELASRLGISLAKLQTHLDTLKFCGMPERYFAGEQFEVVDHGDSIELTNAQALEQPIQLSTPEAHALVVGLDLVSEVPGLDPAQTAAARSARQKILDALPDDARGTADAIQVGLDLGPHEELVADLHRAAQSRSVVELTYHGAGRDEVTVRQVEPLRVESQTGQLYLRAWCRRAQGLRNFRLDRIAGHRQLDETFTSRRLPPDPTLYTAHGHETVATLHFGHRIRDLAAGFQPTHTAELPDGSVLAQVQLSAPDYAFSAVARHGGELTVTAPAALRTSVVTWLEQAVNTYQAGNCPEPGAVD